MLRNHLLTAIRIARRQKLYAAINLLGLTVGMTCSVLMLLWVERERSHDRFHEGAEHIYRVVSSNVMPQATSAYLNMAPEPLIWHLKNDFPEVASAARFVSGGGLISSGDRCFNEQRVLWADPDFLDVFTFPLIAGDSSRVLMEPYTVLITEETARRLFGQQDPIGRTLIFGTVFDLTVTGVLADLPEESHFHFDYLVSMATRRDYWNEEDGGPAVVTAGKAAESWGSLSGMVYFRLRPDTDAAGFEEKLLSFVSDQYEEGGGIGIRMQPLTDIHLDTDTAMEFEPGGDVRYVYLVTALAALILTIACLNYMNLSTARSLQRAREAGVRKVLGASQRHLVARFLSEAVAVSLVSMIAAAGLAELTLPAFGRLVGAVPGKGLIDTPHHVLVALAVAAVVGLVSGAYPALYLSSVRPGLIFRRMAGSGADATRNLRCGLVVVQYTVAIGLSICALTVYRQLQHVHSTPLGYDTANIVAAPIRDFRMLGSFEAFKADLLTHPGIVEVTTGASYPDSRGGGAGHCWWEGKPADLPLHFNHTSVAADFFDFYGMDLTEGEGFPEEPGRDSGGLWILNETAARCMGWETAVGRRFGLSAERVGTVAGIVKDFHNVSLHQRVEPLAIKLGDGLLRSVSLKLAPEAEEAALDHAREVYAKYSRFPFEYEYMADRVAARYAGEQRLWRIFRISALLALFVSCLGILGLAAFAVETRTREIGIRKVLGANIGRIVGLLSGDFAKWVLLANAVAWPLAYYGTSRWLERFAYRATVGWGMYVAAGAAALALAMITVGVQAFRAARANPVDSLRHE